jgi:hypothetical protein
MTGHVLSKTVKNLILEVVIANKTRISNLGKKGRKF